MTDGDRSNGGERRGILRLVTLGGALLQRVPSHGEPEEIVSAGKPFAVLVYVASTPGHTATRDHLIDLLWANLDLDAARHALRQALWYLRKELGQNALRSRGDEVVLSVPVRFDRNRFLEAIEGEDFAGAVELYGGEFLPVYAAPGGAKFEKWADMERYRLKTHFLRAAEIQVRDRLSKGAFDEAQELAARARDADPRNQNTWRLLLESLLAAGDRARAKIEAHALEKKLGEWDREPEPPLRDLLQAAREDFQRSSVTKSTSSLEPELIGREREFAAVLSAWSEVQDGRGAHVHITGGAGLGKSRLLAELDGRLKVMGGRAIHLRAHPGERDLSYALASDLAAALADLPGSEDVSDGAARTLVALNPDLTDRYPVEPYQTEGDETLRRRGVALETLLTAVSGREPLSLLIDDLHWADTESRRLLVSLIGKVESTAALVVTTARPAVDPERISVDHTDQLSLDALSEEELRRLLTSLGGLPDGAWAEHLPRDLHSATGGSPFLVLETLRLALDEGWLSLTQGTWECCDWESLQGELADGRAVDRRLEGLSEEASQLLLLLCVAARPVPAGLLAGARDARPEPILRDLRELEVDGLVARAGDAWVVAHDKIAAAATEGAQQDAIRQAHRCLGRALAADASEGPDELLRAGRHLMLGGDPIQQERVFAQWVTAIRERGDRRPLERLAAHFSDSSPDEAHVQRLVRSLPFRLRMNVTWTRVVAASVVGLMLVAAGVLLTSDAPSPDVRLYLFRPSADGTVSGHELPVSHATLGGQSILDVNEVGDPISQLAGLETRHPVLPGPSGQRWAYVRTVPDSGDWEVFLADEEGSHRRLTYAPADDVPESWSPDGRYLVITTSRWGQYGWQDLAIVDVATEGIRRLTRGNDTEHEARWSPDGARIAFRRQPRRQNPEDSAEQTPVLCWITVDGDTEECFEGPGRSFHLLAWEGSNHLLALVTDSSDNTTLSLVDLETRSTRIVDASAETAVVSPGGQWVAALRTEPGRSARWHVFPADQPGQAVALSGTASFHRSRLAWGYPREAVDPLDRVEIKVPDTIPLNVPIQLNAEGRTGDGRPVSIPTLTWTIARDGGAVIDSKNGVLRPLQLGSVRVSASAGGWREDTVRLVVAEPSAETVFREGWADDLKVRWVPFGDPRPTRSRHPGLGQALWARGDGTFYSGVYSRRTFDASHGLGLEASVSTRRTAPAEQVLSVGLRSWENAEAVEAWDHRTGGLPSAASSCSVRFPGGDGMHTSRQLSIPGRGAVHVDEDLGSGTPYEVRVQIFPDRTFGVAVNGEPIARSEMRGISLGAPHRVVLQGKSVDTRMLIGQLRVWQGIPGDIDWSALDGWSEATRP